MPDAKTYRAGSSIEDYCRACKADRMHAVIAVDAGGQPIRVACGFCRSEHNYRGGPKTVIAGSSATASPPVSWRAPASSSSAPKLARDAFPLISDRERSAPPVMVSDDSIDLELLLRRIIREETGLTPVAPADKWRGGSLVLRPGTPGVQEKSWPIETFFHKVVMLRNRLRTLEQQINASDLPDEIKVRLQSYVTGCYGSLTSFNVLFANEDDQFQGSGSD